MALQANHWRRNGPNTRLEQASQGSSSSSWIRVGTEKEGNPEARAAVKLVQEALMARYVDGAAGCSIPAGATGTFGNQTALAVQALQADPRNNLTPDSGIVGPKVLRVLDQKMLAIEAGAETQPVQRYVLRPDQFVALIEEIHSRYRNSPYRVQDTDVLLRLMEQDYPAHAFFVSRLLAYDGIMRSCIPPDWLGPQSTESWRESVRQEGEVAVGRTGWRASVMASPPPPPPSPFDPYPEVLDPDIRRFLSDLDTLRGANPVAALTFIQLSARGYEAREAMDWSRAAGQTADLLQMSPGGWEAHGNAISPITLQPRRARYIPRTTPTPSGGANRPLAQGPNQMPASTGWPPPTPPERLLGTNPAELRRLLTHRFRFNPAPARRE